VTKLANVILTADWKRHLSIKTCRKYSRLWQKKVSYVCI